MANMPPTRIVTIHAMHGMPGLLGVYKIVSKTCCMLSKHLCYVYQCKCCINNLAFVLLLSHLQPPLFILYNQCVTHNCVATTYTPHVYPGLPVQLYRLSMHTHVQIVCARMYTLVLACFISTSTALACNQNAPNYT